MSTDVTDESHSTGRSAWDAEAMSTAPTAVDLLGLFPPGTRTDGDGTLVVGGCRLDDVAAEFGTPAIVVAEDALRDRARRNLNAFRSRWPRSDLAFASKSFPCTAVQRVMVEEACTSTSRAAARSSPRSRRARIPPGWCCTATPRPTRSSNWPSSTASDWSSSTTSTTSTAGTHRPQGLRQRCLVRVIPGVEAATRLTGDRACRFEIRPAAP